MKTLEVPILKHIGNDKKLGRGFMASDLADAIAGRDFDSVSILLSSPGGSVDEGGKMAAIVASLKADGKRILMNAIGPVASIATVFMMEGDEIVCEPYARFMIHKASLPEEHAQKIYGNVDQMSDMAEAVIATVAQIDEQIIATYKSKRKLKNADRLFAEYYVNEKWMTPQEALSFNLIDRIKLETQNFFIADSITEPPVVAPVVPLADQPTQSGMAYEAYLPKSKGYLRSEMPQVPKEDMGLFMQYFQIQLGFENVTTGMAMAKDLLPTQLEFNKEKILSKKDEGSFATREYIISEDSYLLDGHHDWAAALEVDPRSPLQIIKVGMPIDRLVKEANKLRITISEPV